MNLRDVIKSTVLDILTAQADGEYPTLAGSKVYKDKKSQLIDDEGNPELPAVCIYISDESASEYDNENMKITSSLVLECIADGKNSDEIVDAISNQIEYILAQNVTLDRNVSDVIYRGGKRGVDDDFNSDIVAWTMNYDVEYITPYTADASLLPMLEKFNIDYGNNTTDDISYEENTE